MAMAVGPAEGDDDAVMSTINTTPLVDVMLVLLIIFLITIPVVVHNIKVNLPKEINIATKTKPENINLSVDRDGEMFWGLEPVKDTNDLFKRLVKVAAMNPQPEVLIRGDADVRYESVGKVVFTCERAGILKVDFITEPPVQQ